MQSRSPRRQVDPVLLRTLTSCDLVNALSVYETDRDTAIAWYRQQGFPAHDPDTGVGREVLQSLSLIAAQEGVWREAWAGFHLVLAAQVPGRPAQEVAENCLELGRAHVALHKYEAATVYLKCALILAKEHPHSGFQLRVTAARGVLALLSRSDREYEVMVADLMNDAPSAEEVAAIAFKEGIKNARWADHQGHRLPESLELADAQLRVSLDLNRRLQVSQAVGVILCELGDVHKHVGKRKEAQELYRREPEGPDSVGQC